MARPSGRPLREELITATRPRIQRHGVGGFSYGDLAKELDVKSPSIHHHFPAKADLVTEVTAKYRVDFGEAVASIEGETPLERLQAYVELFNDTAASGLLCLCGAIASEWPDITDGPRAEVQAFFADQLQWLTTEIEAGTSSGTLRCAIEPADAAHLILATLEGAMVMTRPTGDANLTASVGALLLGLLSSP